ncbi:hypothetical protein CYMTET_24181 [Cymbomonas tetramitiformis]|uniref:Uncharacterized protein n=1 Tax=Cymbomonas tetramitiformis TaxID=36881 RepID=A0AAE0FWV9_9CHLO|nr:hypothetical protein CYMTET_24181 [Cymbomonas tetramitiformis]
MRKNVYLVVKLIMLLSLEQVGRLHASHPIQQKCRICELNPPAFKAFNKRKDIEEICLKVLPCDVSGRYELMQEWGCEHGAQGEIPSSTPAFRSVELVHENSLDHRLSGPGAARAVRKAQMRDPARHEENARSMQSSHGDYVIRLPPAREEKMAALCAWDEVHPCPSPSLFLLVVSFGCTLKDAKHKDQI